MMDRPQSEKTGWAQRLQDWETTAPARPGEGPAPDFWDRLEPELPAPSRPGASRPFWLWGTLVLLLLTHFTCFQPEIGYFPLAPTVVAGFQESEVLEREAPATATPDREMNEPTTARREPRPTEMTPQPTGKQNAPPVEKERVAIATPAESEELTTDARREPRLTGVMPQPTGKQNAPSAEKEQVAIATPAESEELTTDARREPRLTEMTPQPTGEQIDTFTTKEQIASTTPSQREEPAIDARREPRLTEVTPQPTGKQNAPPAEKERVAIATPEESVELTTDARREPRLTEMTPRPTGEQIDTFTTKEQIASATPSQREEPAIDARREPRPTGVKELRQTRPRIWVAAHYAPVSNRTRLTLDPGVLTASRTRQTLAPELGLNLYLQLGEHWGLRTGYTSTQVETESQYRFIRFFNPQFESPNTAGDGVSKYNVDVASAYTKSSAEVELVRPRDRILQNGARLRIDLRMRESIALQSIPLQLTYGNRWGRFELSGQLGPEWTNVRVLDFTAGARVQRPGLQTNRVRVQSRERISRNTYWSLSGGLAATYYLGERWRVGVVPEFTTSLENLSARPEFSARSRSAGVRLEVGYRLAGK